MSTESNTTLQPKQRLLYLHARTPNVFSDLIGYTPIEPVPGYRAEITAAEQAWPYRSVHEAICDSWQVVHFPNQLAPFDDREIDIVGYEFILQKIEVLS
jgi:hypothetical protein